MTALLASTPQPPIDPAAIRDHCDVLFGHTEGLVAVRLLAEAGTPDQRPRLEFLDTAVVADRLVNIASQAANQHRGVFVVPGTVVAAGSAKAKDISQTGVVLVDLDHGDISAKREHLVQYLGSPSLEVASGGKTDDGQDKLHLYWRLSEPAAGDGVSDVATLRGVLAGKVGGDPAFKSAHQPVRVAGTVHGKNGRRAAVRILARGLYEYDLADVAEAIAKMPEMPGVPRPQERRRPARLTPQDLAVTTIAAGGQDGETRFGALSRVIGHWLRNARQGACSLEAAWTAVQEHNAAMIAPPWDTDRLQRKFDSLLAKDIAEKGAMPAPSSPDGLDGRSPSTAPALSDDAIAADFAARHGHHWKHVPAWGAWYQWCGTVWTRDETAMVRELVRQVCRSAAQAANTPAEARHLASSKKMAAVLQVAAADPHMARASSQWDTHPMLLNTPSGVVDLTTGQIRPHDPDLLITQMTTASVGCGCPRWTTFLDEITDGDGELRAYLARLAGYCLTGSTREQAFTFLHGHGANGKSVFLRTLSSIMGSYAATAAQDTFMASRADRHLTELAGRRCAPTLCARTTSSSCRSSNSSSPAIIDPHSPQ